MKEEVIAFTDPKSPVSEMFKTLRTNIQFMNTNKALKTLLVTSTLPGEGKSWTAANLAVTFAQAGKKVLIIDADMRKGRQFNIFEIAPTPGLSNYLSGVIDGEDGNYELDRFIKKTELDNLFIMPAGNVPPNPTELLVSEKMIDLIDKVKSSYDMTIFDGTPGLLVADASILSRLVDSTIIVTAHNETKIDNVSEVKKAIENIGGKVAGVVINKIPVSSKKYEDTYYYGHTSPAVVNDHKRKKINFKNQFFKEEKEKEEEKAENIFKNIKSHHNNDDIAKDIYSRFEPMEDEDYEKNKDISNHAQYIENSNQISEQQETTGQIFENKQEETQLEQINQSSENIITEPVVTEFNENQFDESKVEAKSNEYENTYQYAEPKLSWEQEAETAYERIKKQNESENANYNNESANPEYSLDKTQDVLSQINKYLEEQKNNLKNGGNND